MAPATIISNKSILSHFNPTNSLNHRCFKDSSFPHTFSASASIFCPRIVLRRAVSGTKGFWVPRTVKKLIKSSACKESKSTDEGLGGLEQGTFLDGPSESIPSAFVFRRVESIINRLSKWITAIIFNGYIIWRHDAETFWFALGCALNMVLSVELKQILNQERPSTLRSDPGMPSSHAQTFYFIAMFAVLSSIKWAGMNEFTITIGGLTLAFGSYFSYLRVSQQFHTVSQVVVGGGIGMLFSGSWFWLWNALVAHVIQSSFTLKLILLSASSSVCFAYTFYFIHLWLQRQG
ncbi:lipid phosphate phosphatase epsilon 1, chloroplastic-like [Prosopis cineraria]|uniref:lipid phosphate phosphatase epsilon 1, chloroplastic-like n=1 Tax=Prosopis cineraria TaxID=364024 RepID=UPI00240F5254|nr:lipid phosphate phosphatase epsilon 1, chloroplastic-like [Prosopis cineraria]